MLNESCVPVLLKALDQICSLDLIDEAAEDCVLNATKVFQRLLKSTTERTSRVSSTGENVAAQRLKELGGIDTYLRVMEAFKVGDLVSKRCMNVQSPPCSNSDLMVLSLARSLARSHFVTNQSRTTSA